VETILKEELKERQRKYVEQELKVNHLANLNQKLMEEASKRVVKEIHNNEDFDAKKEISKLSVDPKIKKVEKK
jgi:outer membrane translocation and assembly module TamA